MKITIRTCSKREKKKKRNLLVLLLLFFFFFWNSQRRRRRRNCQPATFPDLENKINKIARSNETNKHNRTRRSVYTILTRFYLHFVNIFFFLFLFCVCGLVIFSFLKKSNCERTLFKIYVAKTFSSLLLLLSALPSSVNLFYLRAPLEHSTKLCCDLLILSFALVYKRPAKPWKMGGSCWSKTGKDDDGPQQYKDKDS